MSAVLLAMPFSMSVWLRIPAGGAVYLAVAAACGAVRREDLALLRSKILHYRFQVQDLESGAAMICINFRVDFSGQVRRHLLEAQTRRRRPWKSVTGVRAAV